MQVTVAKFALQTGALLFYLLLCKLQAPAPFRKRRIRLCEQPRHIADEREVDLAGIAAKRIVKLLQRCFVTARTGKAGGQIVHSRIMHK